MPAAPGAEARPLPRGGARRGGWRASPGRRHRGERQLVLPGPCSEPMAGPQLSRRDGDGDEDWQEVYSAVQWIQFVMATLSVTGSSSIIAYAVFQNTVRSPEVRPLFYLSLSDLFLGVCWLAGALLYSMQTTNQDIICYNLQAAGQIFYMASFLYTINYTWHLYMDLKVKYSQNLHRMSSLVLDYGSCLGRTATILCSLIPFLLMVPVFCLGNGSDCYGNFSQKHGCLLMHTELTKPTGQLQPVGGSLCSVIYLYGIGIFLISFWVSFIAILVLLIQARGLYKRYVNSSGFLGSQQWAVIKMVEQRVVFYPIAYFCCWGPAVLLGIMKLTVSENSRLYMALYILQALTAASQGLLNCIVYGWTQNAFQSMKRKACRDVDTQTPLLRSQKKFYASVPNPSTQAVAVSTSTVL